MLSKMLHGVFTSQPTIMSTEQSPTIMSRLIARALPLTTCKARKLNVTHVPYALRSKKQPITVGSSYAVG